MKVQDLTGFSQAEMTRMAKILNDLRPSRENSYDGWFVEFDYPSYGGLPEELSSRLTSDQVDYIQDELQYYNQEFDALALARCLARGYDGFTG